MIDRVICPKIGKHRLKAVGRLDIEVLHTSLKATPYTANRVLALLSKMFNLAIEWKCDPSHGSTIRLRDSPT